MALIIFEGLLLAAMGSAVGLLTGLAALRLLASLKYLQGFIDPAFSSLFLLEVVLAASILGILEAFIRPGGSRAFGRWRP